MATLADTKSRMDEAIRADLLQEAEWDPQITSRDIGGSVKDGVVTLYGFVSSYMEKDAAERAAKRVRGVRAVANDLQIKSEFTRTDAEIARDVVQDITNHIFLPAEEITVTVRNGWVTLEGAVEWQYQKNAAEDSAKSVRGVMGITNNIGIKSRVSTVDIKAKIEEALQRNARLDASRVRVTADGTKVTLSGSVRSWAEREEAEDAAWSAPGVTEIKDQMEITF
jgi:osmotically-inducible protein OsmY